MLIPILSTAVRGVMLTTFHDTKKNPDAKLTVGQEVSSGMLGGMLACWNHPFEAHLHALTLTSFLVTKASRGT